ncbi:MAG: ATP-dependent DNA ligase, partial [Burkholderiales bacterium]
SNPERVIDHSTGITKIELVRYYALVAPLMMPHLKGRPVALVRAPQGLAGQQFFQKHEEKAPITGLAKMDPAFYPGHEPMLEVATGAGLAFCAQMNVIEFHTMNGARPNLSKPDRFVLDLDPGEGVSWPQIQEAAQLVRVLLTELDLPVYLKTSGGKGLHVVVPIKRLHTWEQVRDFSEAVVQHIAHTIPQKFVAKSGPKNRVGKIFIDYLRNGWPQTTACAWTARARDGMGISVPVRWEELPALTGGAHWTIRDLHDRLDDGNAPWEGYDKAAKSLGPAMKRLGDA